MKFKRLMALALAGVMTFAMAGSVLAEGTTATNIGEEGVTLLTKKFEYEKEAATKIDETKDFTFNFAQQPNAEDEPARIDALIKDKTIKFKKGDDSALLKLTLDDLKALEKAGVYTYKVTETTEDTLKDGTGWNCDADEAQFYILRVYVKNDGTKSYTLENKTGKKVHEDGTAEFKNKYIAKAGDNNGSLVISKSVVYPEWATTKNYSFTLKLKETGITSLKDSYSATITKKDKTTEDLTINPSGTTFVLADGDSISIKDIDAGISYEVEEAEYTNCTTEAKASNGTVSERKVTGTLKDTSNTVDYTNTFKNITPTGLAISIAPFVAMFVAVGAAIALYVAAKRRVR